MKKTKRWLSRHAAFRDFLIVMGITSTLAITVRILNSHFLRNHSVHSSFAEVQDGIGSTAKINFTEQQKFVVESESLADQKVQLLNLYSSMNKQLSLRTYLLRFQVNGGGLIKEIWIAYDNDNLPVVQKKVGQRTHIEVIQQSHLDTGVHLHQFETTDSTSFELNDFWVQKIVFKDDSKWIKKNNEVHAMK